MPNFLMAALNLDIFIGRDPPAYLFIVGQDVDDTTHLHLDLSI